MNDDKVYLMHILDSIAHIENFIKGKKKGQFKKNAMVHSAVIRQLEIM